MYIYILTLLIYVKSSILKYSLGGDVPIDNVFSAFSHQAKEQKIPVQVLNKPYYILTFELDVAPHIA